MKYDDASKRDMLKLPSNARFMGGPSEDLLNTMDAANICKLSVDHHMDIGMNGSMGGGKGSDKGGDRGSDEGGPNTSVITKVKPRTKRPSLYRVLILNDDYTPMEFVVHVLERFFQKDAEAATTIMLHVHHHGIGECGVYTYEIAETKVTQVMDFARKHQHPLQCVMEKK